MTVPDATPEDSMRAVPSGETESGEPLSWPQQVTLAEIDAQRAKGWPDWHPEDFCHRCGHRNVSWYVDSETWNVVMRGGDPAGWGGWQEIICPPCFTELAEPHGFTAWRLTRDEHGSWSLTPAPVSSGEAESGARSTCLVPVWDDGIYRVRCSMGTKGVCAKHGPHQPHPHDGRPCDLMDDGYCGTHGVYAAPQAELRADAPAPVSSGGQADGEGERSVVVPADLLVDVARRLYAAGDDAVRIQVEALLDGRDWRHADLAARPVLSREALRERLDGHWKVFRAHKPVGAYLPVGQLDGDCGACGGSWPCDAVLDVLAGEQ